MSSPGAGFETALDRLEFWPIDARRLLAEAWITSAEQLIALASTPDGLLGLAKLARLHVDEMRGLVDLTKARLPPTVVEQMEARTDTSKRGLGAIKPPNLT